VDEYPQREKIKSTGSGASDEYLPGGAVKSSASSWISRASLSRFSPPLAPRSALSPSRTQFDELVCALQAGKPMFV